MKHSWVLGVAVLLFSASPGSAYPLYGSEAAGIGRVEHARLAHEGLVKGRKKVKGELLSLEQVDLRLEDRSGLDLPATDPALARQIADLLGSNVDRYGIAVLDLSDPAAPRYAEINGSVARNPGSVGKVLVAVALFQALADVYPDDTAKRMAILRDTEITADEFVIRDSHKVRFWDPATQTYMRRPLQVGDRGSLFEWLDWMMSASSNAAAATVQKHAMLLKHFGAAYPVSDQEAARFFAETPKAELGRIFEATIQAPVTRSGLDLRKFRQGSFFTRTGKAKVPGTSSYATSREMMRFLLRMEQGRLIDAFSSREIKRLLYMTERRIRYASSPALRNSAVYFKSGSLYSCEPEEGFTCKKYHGNKKNLMNSIAVVEDPAGDAKLHYVVTLMSNVLRKNSAVDHQTLATRIHRLMQRSHGLSTERIAPTVRKDVMEVQRLLNDLGYSPGPADGVVGPRTEAAVRQFRTDRGLGSSVNVDEGLLKLLRGESQ